MTAPVSSLAEKAASDRQIVRLAMGGGLNFVGAVISQAAVFGVTVMLAWGLGTQELGVYSQAFAVRALLVLVCLGGMRSALTRYVALYRAADDHDGVRGTVRLGILFSLVGSVVLGIVLFAAAPFLAHQVFNDPDLEVSFQYVAVSLPPGVLTVAVLSASQGFQTMRPHSLVGLVIEPLLRLALTGVLLPFGLVGALAALLLASVVAATVGSMWLRRLLRPLPRMTPRCDRRAILRYSQVSWLSSLSNQGLLWSDIVILGVFLPSEQVGIYQVASRLVIVAALAVNPLNSSFAPRAADLWHRRRLDVLQRSYTATVNWTLRISLPAFVILALFPRPLLRVFGPDFVQGEAVILILLGGQLLHLATSSSAIVLNMTDRNLLNMFDSAASLVLNVGLNVLLIPVWGISGAAWAWTASLVSLGLLRVFQVRHLVLPSFPFDVTTSKGLFAAALALVVVVGFRAALPPFHFQVPAGIVLTLVVYLAVVALLRLPEDEVNVLRELRRRLPLP